MDATGLHTPAVQRRTVKGDNCNGQEYTWSRRHLAERRVIVAWLSILVLVVDKENIGFCLHGIQKPHGRRGKGGQACIADALVEGCPCRGTVCSCCSACSPSPMYTRSHHRHQENSRHAC